MKIKTLDPFVFQKELIESESGSLLPTNFLDVFFIHSFKESNISLKLPLPPHKKTVNDIVFVKKGKLKRSIGINEFQLTKNDFLFTPKNSITTTTEVSPDLEGYFCHFSDEFINAHPILGLWLSQPATKNYLTLSEEYGKVVEQILDRIVYLYKIALKKEEYFKLISFHLSTLLAELTMILQESVSVSAGQNSLSHQFMTAVSKHFKERKEVFYYADRLNVTSNHLNKTIKKNLNKSASDVINETVVLEAKYLLLETKLDIQEIARELGYEDASYFSRFFKKHSKYSPRDFRKMNGLS